MSLSSPHSIFRVQSPSSTSSGSIISPPFRFVLLIGQCQRYRKYPVVRFSYGSRSVIASSAPSNNDEEESLDDDTIDWFLDEEDFVEPANLDDRRKSNLLAATKTRQETQLLSSGSVQRFSSSAGNGKVDPSKPAKKYSQISELVNLRTSWIPLLDYLSSLGLSESQLLKMYARHTACFKVTAHSAREKVDYLLAIGVEQKDIKRILRWQPQILGYSVENNLKYHVDFLEGLGVPSSRIGKIISRAPYFFHFSVDNYMKRNVRYLIEEIGIKETNLSKVIQLSPQILVRRIDALWSDRYKFLAKEIGAPKDSVVKMVTRHPRFLNYTIEDVLRPKIDFFRSIGMTNSDIVKLLTSMTQVLSLSLEGNLKPKYLYLVNELKNEVQILTTFPAYLTLSLDQRIRPRHRFLVSKKRVRRKGPFPLNSLICSDESFCKSWAKTSLDTYVAFWKKMTVKKFTLKYGKQ